MGARRPCYQDFSDGSIGRGFLKISFLSLMISLSVPLVQCEIFVHTCTATTGVHLRSRLL